MSTDRQAQATFLGITIDDLSYSETLQHCAEYLQGKQQRHIVTVNPEFLMEAKKNSRFFHVLQNADLRIADGFGLRLVAWLTRQTLRHRVTGVDLTMGIISLAAADKRSVYFLGGEEGIARKAAEAAKRRYPTVHIAGASTFPVFASGQETDPSLAQQNSNAIATINASGASVLFVAFGAPKQDQWIAAHLHELPSVRIAMGVGGTFDFLAKKVRRAPKLFRLIGFEWFWRLLLQPSRYRRIFTAVVRFPLAAVLEHKGSP